MIYAYRCLHCGHIIVTTELTEPPALVHWNGWHFLEYLGSFDATWRVDEIMAAVRARTLN